MVVTALPPAREALRRDKSARRSTRTHPTYPTYRPFATNLISNSFGHHLPVTKSRSCWAS